MFFVFANNRSVAGAATPHVASNLGPTDINLMPPYNTPFPTVNFIMSTQLGSGATSRTFMLGQPIWNADGLLDKTPSMAPHPAVNGGVVSGTFLKEASPITYSPNVMVEGAGVVRLLDDTWQNHQNSPGKVITGAMLAQILADYEKMLKEQSDPEPPEEAPSDGEEPENEEGEGDEGDDVTDDQGESAEEGEGFECRLQGTELICRGRRLARGPQLEVVGKSHIECYVNQQGECADGVHPLWTAPTAKGTKEAKAKKIAGFDYDEAGEGAFKGGKLDTTRGKQFRALLNVWNMAANARPKVHTISVECHTGDDNPRELKVHQYPSGAVTIPQIEALVENFQAVKRVIEGPDALDRGGQSGVRQSAGGLDVGNPEVDIVGEWKEWTDWRAYYNFHIDVKMDPAITGYYKKFFPWPAWLAFVQRLLSRLGVEAGPYFRFHGGLGIIISVERTSPDGDWGFSATFKFFLGIRLGVEVSGGRSFYADASGQINLSIPFRFHSPKGLSPMFLKRGDLTAGPIKAIAVIAVAGGAWYVDAAGYALDMTESRYGISQDTKNWDARFSHGTKVWHASVEGEFGGWTIWPASTGNGAKIWG